MQFVVKQSENDTKIITFSIKTFLNIRPIYLYLFFGKATWWLEAAILVIWSIRHKNKKLTLFESLISLCKSLPILVFVIMDTLVIKMSWSKYFKRSLDAQDSVACLAKYLQSQGCFIQVKLVKRSNKHHWIIYSLGRVGLQVLLATRCFCRVLIFVSS